MIKIRRAILHILDQQNSVSIYSQAELDLSEGYILRFIEKHIGKLQKDSNAQLGQIPDKSEIINLLSKYYLGEITFVELSLSLCEQIASFTLQSDNLKSIDIVFCDYLEGDKKLLGILLLDNQEGYTHRVVQTNGYIKNDIIMHRAILPNTLQKVSSFAIINFEDKSVRFLEKRMYVNGEDIFILADKILKCMPKASSKATVKIVSELADKIATEHGINPVLAVSKVKAYVAENAELSDKIEIDDLVQRVFPESEIIQEEYVAHMKDSGLPTTINVDRSYAVRTGRAHKIKTDSGIEISIPADFWGNPEYIEFINNIDGTLSIQIKNIGNISNK